MAEPVAPPWPALDDAARGCRQRDKAAGAVRHVVWDWNGTLLDDVDASVATINTVLAEFGLATLPDLSAYRRVFTFPISAYYERIGLGAASGHFDRAAHRFIEVYADRCRSVGLRPGAREALAAVHAKGIGQAVVSASRAENLAAQMAPFDLGAFLEAALGIADIYAASKEHIARDWLAALADRGIDAGEVLFVGDTAHDAEIAHSLGARVALVADGHMDAAAAAAHGVPVLASPADVVELLAG